MTRDQYIATLCAGATWLLACGVIGVAAARVMDGEYLMAALDACLVVLIYIIHRIFEDYEAQM